MTGPGLAALPEGGRVDFAAVRADRRRRLFDAMDDASLDVLVLGRPANVAFASGARALWTAGSRPFAPSCVAVAADRRIHLQATWDEGVPADLPRDHLWGLSWNPATAADHVASVPGLAGAASVGIDGTSPGLRRLLSRVVPEAAPVDARALLDDVRAAKSPDEVAAIETACALAEAGLAAMAAELRAGTTTRRLLAVHAHRVAELGAPVVPDESVARATAEGWRTVVGDEPLRAGALVALSPSASYAGHEGTVARTIAVDADPTPAQAALGAACRGALDAVLDRCRPGATGADLLDAWAAAGGGDLPLPLAHGLGLGVEAPLIGLGVGRGAVLRDGMVLAVQGWRHERGAGGWLERDVVLVGPDGPRLLTRA